MLSFKLAIKNLLGAGLRTWLNAAVLSLTYVLIIFYNGMLDGWNEQARTDTINWEIGGGQLWEADYDPYDLFTLVDAHSPIPSALKAAVEAGKLEPILITQASMFPEGRMQNVLLKGIDPQQKILDLPTAKLKATAEEIPVIIGSSMAKSAKLTEGDRVLVRWRDKNGMFDAREFLIAHIFATNVPTVDNSQLWMSIEKMAELTGMTDEATLFVSAKDQAPLQAAGWNYKSNDDLLANLNEIIQTKKASGAILYILLLTIALLAVFDTQVLSIFRRQREIGTYIALGMTRRQVVGLFTVEGGMYSIFAAAIAVLWGAPLLIWLATAGIPLGTAETARDAGLATADCIFPVYGLVLVLVTLMFVVVSATIVSYLPARKIAFMRPTDALKGKLQ